MMERITLSIILLLSRPQCIFKEFRMRLCARPSLLPSKDQHKYGSARYLRIRWVPSKNWVNCLSTISLEDKGINSSSSLLTIEQREKESLRSFITRFNKEALTVDEMDNKLLLAAFHNGVNSDLFIHKLYEQEPQTMAELIHSAQNFMNAEDAIIAKKRKRDERMEADLPRHPEQGPHAILSRVLIQRRHKRERRKTETTRRQALQHETSNTRPWTCHLNKFSWKSRMILPWSGRKKWREIPTSAIGTSIAASTKTMGMTRMSVLIWSNR